VAERDPISVVIPVYNSQDSLSILINRLEQAMTAARRDFEVIFVDDGSRDGSWSVVAGLASRSRNIRGIRMLRNYGQHNALLCGIRAAEPHRRHHR
jgi:undecaprenyl-phosphate 4-deoxy-4-formamido-L-arabinose transferase